MVAPIIKEYMDTAVKNDEHLVKLAGVLQRIISKSSGSDEESMLLSDAEKDELMSTLQDTVEDLQNESDRLNTIKEILPLKLKLRLLRQFPTKRTL